MFEFYLKKAVLNDLIGKISVPQNDKEDNLRPPENLPNQKNSEKSSKNPEKPSNER